MPGVAILSDGCRRSWEADLVVDEAAGDPGHEDDVAGPDGDVVSTPLSFRLLQYLVGSTLVEESRKIRSQKITR